MLNFFLKQFGIIAVSHSELLKKLEEITQKIDSLYILYSDMDLRVRYIGTVVEKIEQQTNFEDKTYSMGFYVEIDGELKKVENMFLKVTQKLPVSIKIADKFGNPAVVDGAPKWAVTDEALASVEVAEDGMSAVVMPKGVIGACKVQVSADADLGEGVKAIIGELDVEFLAGEAAVVGIVAGEAVEM